MRADVGSMEGRAGGGGDPRASGFQGRNGPGNSVEELQRQELRTGQGIDNDGPQGIGQSRHAFGMRSTNLDVFGEEQFE